MTGEKTKTCKITRMAGKAKKHLENYQNDRKEPKYWEKNQNFGKDPKYLEKSENG